MKPSMECVSFYRSLPFLPVCPGQAGHPVESPRPPTPRSSGSMASTAHYLLSGRYEIGKPLPAEGDQPELANLPRLICTPRRSHYGKMRKMINALNQSEIAS